jgi:DNA-binding transcriptional MerR regulator
MTIGEVAKAAGVTASAIRFYESAGVLRPPSRRNGIRHYDPSVVEQLRVLRFYRSSGVSIEDLAAMFSDDTASRSQNRHEIVVRRIEELDRLILDAQAMKRRLRKLLDCKCNGNRRRCVIFKEAASK